MSFELTIDIEGVKDKSAVSLHYADNNPYVIYVSGSDGEYTTIDVEDVEVFAEALLDMLSLARAHAVNNSLKNRKAKRSGMIGD